MLGLTRYISRLRAVAAALMPSAAVALGLMGVSGAAADDGAARGSGSRTGTVLRHRLDAAQVRARWQRSIQMDARRILNAEKACQNRAPVHETCVSSELTARAAASLAQLSTENTGKPFRVVLDGKVFSAPAMRQEISGGGRGLATSNFSADESARFAVALRSGALPAPLLLAGERTIELTARRRE